MKLSVKHGAFSIKDSFLVKSCHFRAKSDNYGTCPILSFWEKSDNWGTVKTLFSEHMAQSGNPQYSEHPI